MKTNSIYEALGNVDDKLITEAAASRKKRPVALIIAASAAALALLVGFVGSGGGKHKFAFSSGNSNNRGFYLELSSQEFTIPEEFMPQDGEMVNFVFTNTLPTELFGKFGVTPLMNDNFTNTTDVRTQRTDPSDGKTHTWEPLVEVRDGTVVQSVKFEYFLYDKNIDEIIRFNAEYFSDTNKLDYYSHMGLLPDEHADIITLNNGSLCMVTDHTAVFSYDGVAYEFTFDNWDEASGVDTVKQVLNDLGVL